MDVNNMSGGLRSSRKRSTTNSTPIANILSLSAFEQILQGSGTPNRPVKTPYQNAGLEQCLFLQQSPQQLLCQCEDESPEPEYQNPDLLPPKMEQMVTFSLPEWEQGELVNTATQTPKQYHNTVGIQTDLTLGELEYNMDQLHQKELELYNIHDSLRTQVEELKMSRKHFESEKLAVARQQNRQRQVEKEIKTKSEEIQQILERVERVRVRVMLSEMKTMEARYNFIKKDALIRIKEVCREQHKVFKFYNDVSYAKETTSFELPVTLSHGRHYNSIIHQQRPLQFSFKQHKPAVVPLLSLNSQNLTIPVRSATNVSNKQSINISLEQALNDPQKSNTVNPQRQKQPRKPIVRKGINYPLNYKR